MKQRMCIGNLKMHLQSPEEAEQYLTVLVRELQGKHWEKTELTLAVPFVHLARFHKKLPSTVTRGAQDVFYEKEGSYTGEISPLMLKNEGVTKVLVGHSERRMYGGDTDALVAAKLRAVLKAGMIPVLCLGETEEERRVGKTASVLTSQLSTAFEGVSPLDAARVIVAYEPRWAIGTDVTPSTEDILEARVLIVRTLSSLYTAVVAERIPVLYGGSVKAGLLDTVCFQAQMDGVLVGRESLFPFEMVKMTDMIERYEAPVHVSQQ